MSSYTFSVGVGQRRAPGQGLRLHRRLDSRRASGGRSRAAAWRAKCCARADRSCSPARSRRARPSTTSEIAREAIREIGYTDPDRGVQRRRREGHPVHQQAVGRHRDGRRHRRRRRPGHHVRLRQRRDAGADAAPDPARAPAVAAPRDGRKKGERAWLRPDVKTQVSVRYEDNQPDARRDRARLHAARGRRVASRDPRLRRELHRSRSARHVVRPARRECSSIRPASSSKADRRPTAA